MRQKLNTMTELADAIGISRPTLSRYFEDPSSVRKSTRRAIDDGLKQFDYVPNFFARHMNRKKTRLLGVVIPALGDQFYSSLVEIIESYAIEQDFSVHVQNSHGSEHRELGALESLRSMNAAGVILAPVGGDSSMEAYVRINRDMPLVLLDSQPIGAANLFPFVGNDNAQSVRLLVDYLCRSGLPPAFLRMPRVNSNAEERAATYTKRMQDLGHEPVIINAASEVSTWNFEEYAYDFMAAQFAMGRYTEATILCANDRLAMGVLRAANEFNLFALSQEARGTFRVAGHDNHPLSRFLWPSLTTASQDVVQMGRTAFDLVVERSHDPHLHDAPAPRRLFEAHLVLRDSA